MRVKLYIEGGGESRSLHIKCREGFRKLFEKAGFRGRMPSTKACGGRDTAYDDFKIALRTTSADEYPILIVDSEAAVSSEPAWQHLQSRDGWTRPENAEDDQAQLMVQCMETWCIADRKALRAFFGAALHENAIPAHDLESVSKENVQSALYNATRYCGRGKAYAKGKRSFDLLAQLNPAELKSRLPHFNHLCRVLDEKL